MDKKKLADGLKVSPVVLGGNVFGWTIDEKTSFAVLDAAVDGGLTTIDTADVYSAWVPGNQGGESETIIGKWLKQSGKRDQVQICTKVGHSFGNVPGGLKPEYIKTEVEKSLKRLQVEAIDLYYSHKDDENTPLAETLGAYDDLIQAGKVRFIGASNYTGARLAEALEIAKTNKLPGYVVEQPEYNLYDRAKYETDLAPVLAKTGLKSLPYFSLASGFLTGKYQKKEDAKGANRESRVDKYFDDRGLKILKALAQVQQETGASQAAIALAWLIAQPTVAAPIASGTKVSQLDALFEAGKLKLTDAHVKLLTDASAY